MSSIVKAKVKVVRTRQYGEAVTVLWDGDWSGSDTTYHLDGTMSHGNGVPNYLAHGRIEVTEEMWQTIQDAIMQCAENGDTITLEFTGEAKSSVTFDYDDHKAELDAYLKLNDETSL